MKRAELIVGQSYYVSTKAGWRNNTLYGNGSYFKTAQDIKRSKFIVVETQLKTDYEKKYRTREVLMQNYAGEEKWIDLNHVRCEWIKAVQLKTEDTRRVYCSDKRDQKYRQHLARKQEREVYTPTYNKMRDLLKETTGKSVWGYDRIEHGFTLEQLQTINEALTLLKTQKSTLKVAS